MNKQKEAELLMIDAEEQSLRQLPSSVDVAQKLNTLAMARKKIIEQIRDLDPNYQAHQTASSRSYGKYNTIYL